jgi:uncharacterized damage-inducible protein DinB
VSPALEEKQVLLGALRGRREHVLDALEGLDIQDLRRSLLPSGWSCLGLVNHLSLDVERFWFQAVVAGDEGAIEEALSASENAWNVGANERGEDVLRRYQENAKRADAIITSHSLDAAPTWWPDFFGSWRLHSLREIVIHVVVEVATHAGHLDAARELIDGKQHLVLTD